MSSTSSPSSRNASSSRPQRLTSITPNFAGRHSTVNCQACNRSMVPRVVTYYGQPLRSVCPFCGATFMKFSSGLQRLLRHFQTRSLSFSAFKWLTLAALCFGLLGAVSDWVKLPVNISLYAAFGTIGFGLMALAELFVQCVERMAAKLCHESNYYWAGFTAIAIISANQNHDLVNYLLLFSLALLVRGLIVGSVRALSGSKSYRA